MGKYTLVGELGRGGMGTVYKAWDGLLQQFVALKVIRVRDLGLSGPEDDAKLKEFLREARTAVKLQHPNIIRVYELGRHGDLYYLSMEFVDGASLHALLHGERPGQGGFYRNPRRFLAYLRDVALALDHAHRHDPPIVHRDVKPQNILVDGRGRACIVDFGLAKELKAGGRLTVSGVVKGTPSYMAPEQIRGRGVDARTDVYAIGAVLYECLAGRPPFTGRGYEEICHRVIGDPPERPRDALRRAGASMRPPPELENVCLKALEKEKERRYGSTREFADDLERFLAGEPVAALAAGAPVRAWRWAARRRAAVLSTAAAVVMGIVALAAILRDRGTERVVERVVVEDESARRFRDATREIERLASEMRFGEAAAACEGLLAGTQEGLHREALRQRLEEMRLQENLLRGLAGRIGRERRDYERFSLKTDTLNWVRVMDADAEGLLLRHREAPRRCPWGTLAPRQFLRLVQDCWPDLDGKGALALGVWCLRQGLSDEAAYALKRHAPAGEDAQAKRFVAELQARDRTSDPDREAQFRRILTEAEEALAAGDLIIARARFERALTLKPGAAEPLGGVSRVESAEKAMAASPRPPREEAPAAARAIGPGESVDLAGHASSRREFLAALRGRDPAKAAGIAVKWPPIGLLPEPALSMIGQRAGADPVVGRLREAIEDWLANEKTRGDLDLRIAFDLRDLVQLAMTRAELEGAVEGLIRDRVEVTLLTLGPPKKGLLQKARGGLVFQEIVEIGGHKGLVGKAINIFGGEGVRLGARDLVILLSKGRERTRATADWRTQLGEALLLGCDDPSGPGGALAEPRGVPEADRPRLRMDDYLRLQKSPATWSVDLLRPEARSGWTLQGQMVTVNDAGLLLESGAEIRTRFEGARLVPGSRLEMKFRFERIDVPDQARLVVAFLGQDSRGEEVWRETVQITTGTTGPNVAFFEDSDRASIIWESAGVQGQGWHELVLDLFEDRALLRLDGKQIGPIRSPAPPGRKIALQASQAQVRFGSIRAAGLTEPAPATAAPGRPAAIDEFAEFLQRGLNKYAARDYLGAVAEFTRAIDRKPADAYAYQCRGGAREGAKDRDGAIADYTRAIELGPATADPHRRRGALLYARREYGRAIADLSKAMELEPNKGDDYHARAHCRYDTRSWAEAAADLRRALQLGSWNDDYAHLYLWLTRARLGDRVAATEELKGHAARRTGGERAVQWFQKIALFLTDQISESALLQAAAQGNDEREVRERECEAYFYAGTKRLVEGDKDAAAACFQKSVGTGIVEFIEYLSAQAELDPPKVDPIPPATPARPAEAPAAAGGEKVLASVSEASWSLLGVSPDGTVAAVLSGAGGKASVVLHGERGEAFDQVDPDVLWARANTPVYRAHARGKWHVIVGRNKHDGFSEVTDLVVSPDGKSVAYIGRMRTPAGREQFYLVVNGRKVLYEEVHPPGFKPNTNEVTATVRKFMEAPLGAVSTVRTLMIVGTTAREVEAAGSPVFSEDGRTMAYPAFADLGLYVLVDGRQPGPTFRKVSRLVMSRNGRSVAYVAQERAQWEFLVFDDKAGPEYNYVGPPVLNADGTQVAAVAYRGNKKLVLHDGWESEEFDDIAHPFPAFDQPVFSPEGKRVAFIARQGSKTWLVAGRRKFDAGNGKGPPAWSPDGKSVSFGATRGADVLWRTIVVE